MEWLVLVVVVVVGLFLVTALFGAPYLPSKYSDAVEAFEKLCPSIRRDVVVDFGCGDGVVLLAATKAGVKRAVGFELNPLLVVLAKLRCRKNRRVQVRLGNMLSAKLPEDMTVAYVFGLDRVMRMLKPRLAAYAKEQKRDIFVISLAFRFEGMKPEKVWKAYGLYRICYT